MVRYDAGNDVNGNPRRAYVRYESPFGQIMGVWKEGYRGYHAVPEIFVSEALKAPTAPTTPKYYRELLKWAKLRVGQGLTPKVTP
jgi:hypothetical protein